MIAHNSQAALLLQDGDRDRAWQEVIGPGGSHHSIAGSVEMFTAYLIGDEFSAGQSFRFIGWALAGNLLGGSFFVAVLNYAHIRKSRVAET